MINKIRLAPFERVSEGASLGWVRRLHTWTVVVTRLSDLDGIDGFSRPSRVVQSPSASD